MHAPQVLPRFALPAEQTDLLRPTSDLHSGRLRLLLQPLTTLYARNSCEQPSRHRHFNRRHPADRGPG